MNGIKIDLTKYAGQTISVEVVVPGGSAPADPNEPSQEVLNLTGYRYGESDAPGHIGEWYFVSSEQMFGKIKAVSVGGVGYYRAGEYKGRDLWYGKPSSGVIRVVMRDGQVYESGVEQAATVGQEKGRYVGRANGNRPHFRFSKPMSGYPLEFTFVAGDGYSHKVKNNHTRYDPGGGFLAKNGEHDKKLVILAPSSCKATSGKIVW